MLYAKDVDGSGQNIIQERSDYRYWVTNEAGCGSCSFRQVTFKMPTKNNFFLSKFFLSKFLCSFFFEGKFTLT
jgi:hypothetical protein